MWKIKVIVSGAESDHNNRNYFDDDDDDDETVKSLNNEQRQYAQVTHKTRKQQLTDKTGEKPEFGDLKDARYSPLRTSSIRRIIRRSSSCESCQRSFVCFAFSSTEDETTPMRVYATRIKSRRRGG